MLTLQFLEHSFVGKSSRILASMADHRDQDRTHWVSDSASNNDHRSQQSVTHTRQDSPCRDSPQGLAPNSLQAIDPTLPETTMPRQIQPQSQATAAVFATTAADNTGLPALPDFSVDPSFYYSSNMYGRTPPTHHLGQAVPAGPSMPMPQGPVIYPRLPIQPMNAAHPSAYGHIHAGGYLGHIMPSSHPGLQSQANYTIPQGRFMHGAPQARPDQTTHLPPADLASDVQQAPLATQPSATPGVSADQGGGRGRRRPSGRRGQPRPRDWTPAETNQLRQLKERGLTNKEAADQMGKTASAVGRKWWHMRNKDHKSGGHPGPRGPQPPPPPPPGAGSLSTA